MIARPLASRSPTTGSSWASVTRMERSLGGLRPVGPRFVVRARAGLRRHVVLGRRAALEVRVGPEAFPVRTVLVEPRLPRIDLPAQATEFVHELVPGHARRI